MGVHTMSKLLALLCGSAIAAAEQVHLALGGPGEIRVQWVTPQRDGEAAVRFGTAPTGMPQHVSADTRVFTVDQGRQWFTNVASMTGLVPNTRYYYQVLGAEASAVYNFSYLREGKAPYKHIILGDMGSSCAFSLCLACRETSLVCDAATCATNRTDVGLVSELDADMFLHVGDFAYDLGSQDGIVGDQFFRNIEQVAAYVPYMVSHGNHEDDTSSLAHYIESFRLMPTNAVPSTFTTANGPAPNTLYFSWDRNLVHYVAISTELWFGVTDNTTTLATQLSWLRRDLEAANARRAEFPWIVVHGHRSMYCSCDNDCNGDAKKVRSDLEPILFKYGVDFFINGHEHNYERTWPTYRGNSDQSYMNPKATIYMVSGAAGSRELHEPFTLPQPSWSAFRSNSFSYSRLLVHNATHLQWQQVQTDPTLFPATSYGRVIDNVWVVQEQHGPFNESQAPRSQPKSCPSCRSEDHWRPLLNIDNATSSSLPFDAVIRDWRAVHGDDAWRSKLSGLLHRLQPSAGSTVEWEDVRGDGNSDGAWAFSNGWTWKSNHA